ncbi:glutamine synthetase family protein (plasmid) [Streptomyces sp. NBC_00637]|uniref:glutamine synthetase family protein n=1 Tax=Streptomyces sp. NBC_00637 TaxID=2903667 RepID=UPI002F90A91D
MTGPTSNRPSTTPNNPVNGLDQLSTLVRDGVVTSVMLATASMQGGLKGKTYDAAHFLDEVAVHGASLCGYLLATDADMHPLPGFGIASWDTGYGDMRFVTDLATLRMPAWLPETALVLADPVTDDQEPLAVAPRHILKRQLRALDERGIAASVGLEAEFVLYRGTRDTAARAGHQDLKPLFAGSRDYSLHQPPLLRRYLTGLRAALSGSGLRHEAFKGEGASGQVEITFPHGAPLHAADQHMLLRHAAAEIGAAHRVLPLFMSAPDTGVGSGLHVHLSLHDTEGQRPLFDSDGTDLSEAAQHVIAGLLTALPFLAPLWAPTVNAYKRLTPGTCAPVNYSWGFDNRTCAIRIVGTGTRRHLEIRLPGADANPYNALAVILAAAGYGLDNKLAPPLPVDGNAVTDSALPPVPRSLDEALQLMSASELAGQLLSTEVVQHYALAAHHEAEAHRVVVSSEERRREIALLF